MKKLFLSLLSYFKPTNNANTDLLMWTALSEASLQNIESLHKNGIQLPQQKTPYSHLFQKKTPAALPAQRYVINNLDDIAFGEQIILKTLTHPYLGKNDFTLLKEVLEVYSKQYTSEEVIELLPKALENRVLTEEGKFVKKFYAEEIRKVKDIAFGDQFVLKMLISPNWATRHTDFIAEVLHMYEKQYEPHQIVELIPKILPETSYTEEVDLVTEWYKKQVHKKGVLELKDELDAKDAVADTVQKKRIKI